MKGSCTALLHLRTRSVAHISIVAQRFARPNAGKLLLLLAISRRATSWQRFVLSTASSLYSGPPRCILPGANQGAASIGNYVREARRGNQNKKLCFCNPGGIYPGISAGVRFRSGHCRRACSEPRVPGG